VARSIGGLALVIDLAARKVFRAGLGKILAA
jgi:hypothetical protein